MDAILILFAHPRFEKSRVNRALLAGLRNEKHITINDLYERYPDFNIDAEREKELILAHSVIVWHHPLYMYSAPAIIKQWIDLVLEHGWAHGEGGCNTAQKIIFNTVTTGGTKEGYSKGGRNRFTLRELLLPFEQTAHLCNMTYVPPFTVQGTYRLAEAELNQAADLYRRLLNRLARGDFRIEEMRSHEFLNDWMAFLGAQE